MIDTADDGTLSHDGRTAMRRRSQCMYMLMPCHDMPRYAMPCHARQQRSTSCLRIASISL